MFIITNSIIFIFHFQEMENSTYINVGDDVTDGNSVTLGKIFTGVKYLIENGTETRLDRIFRRMRRALPIVTVIIGATNFIFVIWSHSEQRSWQS